MQRALDQGRATIIAAAIALTGTMAGAAPELVALWEPDTNCRIVLKETLETMEANPEAATEYGKDGDSPLMNLANEKEIEECGGDPEEVVELLDSGTS